MAAAVMHFHELGKCLNCGRVEMFDTPIPNILVLSSVCVTCGWNDVIGWNVNRACDDCYDMWHLDVQREASMTLHHPRLRLP